MTELEFKSLAAQGYNRIPLIAEAFADLETPLTLYLKLAQTQNAGRNTFLLESVVGGERFGRYSFIGLPASTLLRSTGPCLLSRASSTFSFDSAAPATFRLRLAIICNPKSSG